MVDVQGVESLLHQIVGVLRVFQVFRRPWPDGETKGLGTIDPQQAQFEVENFWAGALREAAIEGKVRSGSLMAGQSVGLADKVMPIRDIIAELVEDAETELQKLHEVFNTSCI